MASKIQIRRDTASNWTSANPTLNVGEFGYETDTGYLKIGDGSTAWTSLSYIVQGATTLTLSDITDITASSATTGQILVAQSDNTFAFEDTQYFDGAYSSLTGAPTNVSSFTNDSGYITGYTVTESDVTTHQAALSITESQISDLGSYLTSVSESDVTTHQAALSITESQISDLQSYLTSVSVSNLSDVSSSAATTGDVLVAQSDGTFAFTQGSTATNLNSLTDVNASSTTTDQVLTAQADSTFAFEDVGASSVYRNIYVFTASSGQTSFSGADDNNYAVTFTSGQPMVFLNGGRLQPDVDYTEDSDLAGITLTVSANPDDTLQIVTWEETQPESAYSFQGSNYGYTVGGHSPTYSNRIQRYSYTSASNATDEGDLTIGRYGPSSQKSTDYGYTSGGSGTANGTNDKFPFASGGNASSAGSLVTVQYAPMGQSSADYGYVSGGSAPSNVIQKFPFASDWSGTSTDVGDLTVARWYGCSQSSSTDGFTAAGNPGYYNVIDKFPFSTDANAADHGDLTGGVGYGPAGHSSTTEGYRSGGYTGSRHNTIDRFSFDSNTTATDHGDLITALASTSGSSQSEYGYTAGGYSPGGGQNAIQKFAFGSGANASDVADLFNTSYYTAGNQY
jgi:hypothetical protein